MLQYESFGSEETPRLLIAHGLFGSGRNWRAIAKRLSAEFHVTTIDMRNHGGSFWSDDMSYEAMAGDLADVIETLGVPAMVLGHSMGGKASMVLALSRPELVERLVVADIAPIAYGHSHGHFIDAMQSIDLSRVNVRSDVGDALAELVEDPALRSFFMQSVVIENEQARWMLNLPVLREAMTKIIGFPDLADVYPGRTLFISGALSDYVDDAGRAAIKPLFPNSRFAKLKDAGHWLHADQPKAFIETVQAFCRA